MPQQPVRVADQRIHQLLAGRNVVPGDRRFTRVVVVMGSAVFGDYLAGTGHLAAHSPDRADQLGHGVLGGHCVIEHRGIQRPPRLPRERPSLSHHSLDRLKDPVGPIRGRQPPPPVGQRRGMKRPRAHRHPARRLPPKVKHDRIHRLAIGQAV